MPIFNKTAESSTLITEGALACAWGSQVWNGTMPALAAKPIKIKMKANVKSRGDIVPACFISVSQFSVPVPVACLVMAKRIIRPIIEKSIAVEAVNTYFRAATIFSLAFRVTMSTAERMVVNSSNIQKSAKLLQ